MVRKPGVNTPLFLAVVLLSFLGLIAVYSSSAILSAEVYGKSYFFFLKHFAYVAAGLALLSWALLCRFDFYRHPLFLYGLYGLSLLLLLATLNSPIINGTQRWLRVGPFSFQPSELAKLSLIIVLAHYLTLKKELLSKGYQVLAIPAVLVALVFLLILKQPDLGTAFIVLAISGVMFFVAGINFKYVAWVMTAFVASVVGMICFYDYARARIVALFDYEADPLGKGFQIVQSLIALGSGGMGGVGLGDSTQKLYFLPYAHTDFIFAVIGEEMGFLVAFPVLLLYLVVMIQGYRAAINAPDMQQMLIATGITTWIFSQAMLNISVVIGIFPPKGITLPFISSGGSSLLVLLFAAGILIRVASGKAK